MKFICSLYSCLVCGLSVFSLGNKNYPITKLGSSIKEAAQRETSHNFVCSLEHGARMACFDPLRNSIRQQLRMPGQFDALIELKMKTLVGELIVRHFNTLENIANLVVLRGFTIERVVRELQEKLFDEHASWLFILCILALLNSLMRHYEKSVRRFALEKLCLKIEHYLVPVWAPWIEGKGHGWIYLMDVIEYPHWVENRMMNKLWKTIVNMN